MSDLTETPLADLKAESQRLTALRAWGPRLAAVNAEIRRRHSVELAQDAYYHGTAADLREQT